MENIKEVIEEVRANDTAKSCQENESSKLVEDFKDVCGFNQKEAEEATYQVLMHEEYALFDF